jgi:hypothetical protein
MPVAQTGLVRLTENLEKVAPFHAALTPDRLSVTTNEIAIVISSFQDEMEARLHFAFPRSSARYFSDGPQFGAVVEDVFPNVSYDVVEAGKCLALGGRWTAQSSSHARA